MEIWDMYICMYGIFDLSICTVYTYLRYPAALRYLNIEKTAW